jgi:hypothetical protein
MGVEDILREMERHKEAGLLGRVGPESDVRTDEHPVLNIIAIP